MRTTNYRQDSLPLPGNEQERQDGTEHRPLSVKDLPDCPRLEGHYIFNGISRGAVTEYNHGLHKYPAKFIPQLPRWALQYKKQSRRETVLDPFCGSGTTLIEAGLDGNYAIGYDISPLAVMIGRAKTAILRDLKETPAQIVSNVIRQASLEAPKLQALLVVDKECLGLHYNWGYWFEPIFIARLLGIRNAISDQFDSTNPILANFLLVCLSSIAKSASYLNEDQIKVRKDKNKTPLDPFTSFSEFARKALSAQLSVAKLYEVAGADFMVEAGSASDLPLENGSVDRIITSPPYINAVDYTMTHKYNLFILGLVSPQEFKDHCREYIGMTERAVKRSDLKQKPEIGIAAVDKDIDRLWALETPVSQNRAFVVAQFFNGMYAAMKEAHRIVRVNGKIIFVVGNINRICGCDIETGALIENIAREVGLETELRFYHHIANRSSMRLNRAETGGKIKFEIIFVFNRP